MIYDELLMKFSRISQEFNNRYIDYKMNEQPIKIRPIDSNK